MLESTKTQIVFGMLMEITRNPQSSPSSIQKKFGIGKDKYYRYFNELCHFIPLTYCREKNRYLINPPATFSEILSCPNDLLVFLLMLSTLSKTEGMFDSKVLKNLQCLLGLESELSLVLKHCIEMEKSLMDEPFKENILAINNAICLRHRIKFKYSPDGENFSDVVVEPYRLVHDVDWYLLGYSLKRSGRRNYKINRMKDAQVLDEGFNLPEDIEVKTVSMPWDFSEEAPVQVKLEFSGFWVRYIREKNLHPTQNITLLKDDKIEFSVKVSAPDKMLPWIMSFGQCVKVIEPDTLKAALVEEIEKVKMMYGRV